MKIIVRNETQKDYRRVEEITREAFAYPDRIERGGIGCPYEHWIGMERNHAIWRNVMDITIRRINTEDHYSVECMTKRAFWNLNMPGCDEHYLVHRIWNEPDYVSSISLLAEIEGVIVGVILYTKCRVETENGDFPVLTFGPLCVDPEYQKKGIGSRLLVESMELARQQNYKGILICGVPTYYPKFGFKTADTFGITMPDGSNFDAFMGYELQENALSENKGKFYEPKSLDCDVHDEEYMRQLEEFDKNYPYMEKKVLPGQWR